MITQVTEESLQRFQTFCQNTPFGCKIEGLWRAYGLDLPFARFWIQESMDGKVTAALSFLDGAVVLDWRPVADTEELTMFLSALACNALLCAEQASQALYGKADRKGAILVRQKSADLSQEGTSGNGSFSETVSIRDVFQLLCDCGELKAEQFEPFYLDVSHRVRHNAAIAGGMNRENRLVACALVASITKNMAVLSAVAVHPDVRRQKIGDRLLRHILSILSPRQVFVLCGTEQAKRFYHSLSFSEYGQWSELDF